MPPPSAPADEDPAAVAPQANRTTSKGTTRFASAHTRAVRLARAAWKHLRLALPALFANFVLSVLFLVRPVSQWTGPFAFLTFFHIHLFFYPSPLTVGQNLQSALLGLIGSAVGCAVGLLCVAISHWTDGDRVGERVDQITFTPYVSSGARAFAACALIIVSFLNGLLSSGVPRFKNFSRICLFNLSWIITRGSETRAISYALFSEFFYPSVLSAGAGILANLLIFPTTGVSVFLRNLAQTFEALEVLVNDSTQLFFVDYLGTTQKEAIQARRARFTSSVSRLGTTYEAAGADIALVHVPVRAYFPFLKILQRSRGWIASGIEVEVDGNNSWLSSNLSELHSPVRALAEEIIASLALVRMCLLLVSGGRLPAVASGQAPKYIHTIISADHSADPALAHRCVMQQRADITAAVERIKLELHTHLDIDTPSVEDQTPVIASHSHDHPPERGDGRSTTKAIRPLNSFNNRMYAASYLVLSLMEIAQCCIAALVCTQNILRVWNASKRRHVQWPWTTLHGSQAGSGGWAWRRWASQAGPGTLNDLLGSMQADKYGLDADDLFADNHDSDGVKSRSEEAEAERREKAARKEDIESHAPTTGDDAASTTASASPATLGDLELRRRTGFDIFAEADPDLTRQPSAAATEVEAIPGRSRAVFHRLIRIPHILLAALRTQEAIHRRVRLSNALQSFKENRHLRFAIKLSLGCLVLTVPAWLPVDGAREWWYGERGQWALISFVWCLETSTGATVRVSTFRLIGTVAGSVYGYLIWLICGSNPYALCFFILIAEVFAAYMILETAAQGIGIVFALTFPIIALIPYLNLPYTSVAILAWERGFMVTIGIVAALFVNLTLWPFHARVQLVIQIARATGRLQRLYLSLSRQMLNTDLVTSRDTRKAFEQLERSILKTLAQSRSLIALMSVEVSLAPKPTVLLGKIISHLGRIADLLVGLRLCRQHGLKGSIHKYLVLNVLDHRTELVSAILLSFFAVGASIRNRTPIPQFLPSPRLALEELTASLHEQLSRHQIARTGTATPDLPGTATTAAQPDAYHALSSLYHRRPGWRRTHSSSGVVLAGGTSSARDSRSRSPTTRTPHGSVTPRLAASASFGVAALPTSASSTHGQPSLLHSALVHRYAASATTGATPHPPPPPPPPHAHTPNSYGSHSNPAAPPPPPPPPGTPPKLAHFFLLAEHSLLAQIVSELESVLELTRRLVGTATVLEMAYDVDPAAASGDGGVGAAGLRSTWHSLHQGPQSSSH